MSIIDLYREHINPDADGSEIHELLQRFNFRLRTLHPTDDAYNSVIKRIDDENRERCIKWIIDNSIKNRAKNYMRLKNGYKENDMKKEQKVIKHYPIIIVTKKDEDSFKIETDINTAFNWIKDAKDKGADKIFFRFHEHENSSNEIATRVEVSVTAVREVTEIELIESQIAELKDKLSKLKSK